MQKDHLNGENRKVGYYEWRQISMWEFAPPNAVELFVPGGRHTFHYILHRITEASDNRWRFEVVTSTAGVPQSVLKWRGGSLRHVIEGAA